MNLLPNLISRIGPLSSLHPLRLLWCAQLDCSTWKWKLTHNNYGSHTLVSAIKKKWISIISMEHFLGLNKSSWPKTTKSKKTYSIMSIFTHFIFCFRWSIKKLSPMRGGRSESKICVSGPLMVRGVIGPVH